MGGEASREMRNFPAIARHWHSTHKVIAIVHSKPLFTIPIHPQLFANFAQSDLETEWKPRSRLRISIPREKVAAMRPDEGYHDACAKNDSFLPSFPGLARPDASRMIERAFVE